MSDRVKPVNHRSRKPDHRHAGVAVSRKRKERDVANHPVSMTANTKIAPPPPPLKSSIAAAAAPASGDKMKNSNWLLAGYLAHEFLNHGTLLGQKWDPERTVANPMTPRNTNNVIRSGAPVGGGGVVADVKGGGAGGSPTVLPQEKVYADVSNLLKSSEGVHIEGVVNPTQLANWLHL